MEATKFSNAHQLEFGGHPLWLDPSGAIFWPSSDSLTTRLLVADLHLGRETTLQRSGIALPTGGTTRTLERLAAVVASYQPDELWILGDLIHSRSSFSQSSWDAINGSFSQLAQRPIHLVEGNHDRYSRRKLSELPLVIHTTPIELESLCFAHDAERDLSESSIHRGVRPVIAGHLHPGYRLPDTGERIKCFHVTTRLLTMPAFGEQTGSMRVTRAAEARIFLATGSSVIAWQ